MKRAVNLINRAIVQAILFLAYHLFIGPIAMVRGALRMMRKKSVQETYWEKPRLIAPETLKSPY